MRYFSKLSMLFPAVIFAASLFVGLSSVANAADDHKIVVQISSADSKAQGRTLKRIGWILDDFNGKASVEVVAIGPAFGMLAKTGKFAGKVKKLMGRGVVFTACSTIQKMLKKMGHSTDLVDGVKHVKVGPAHIIRLQAKGYKYLALFFGSSPEIRGSGDR